MRHEVPSENCTSEKLNLTVKSLGLDNEKCKYKIWLFINNNCSSGLFKYKVWYFKFIYLNNIFIDFLTFC